MNQIIVVDKFNRQAIVAVYRRRRKGLVALRIMTTTALAFRKNLA